MKTSYIITKESEGSSLKEYLEEYHLGKEKIKRLFQIKQITLNGESPSEDSLLHENDVVSIAVDEEIDFIPDQKKLDIIYEDDYLLAVHKPCHILVHPDDKQKRGTMCNIVAFYYQNRGWNYAIRYVHRLDMDTTGVLLFAKDSLTLAKLDYLISSHTLKRTYLCLVQGIMKKKSATIDAPIGEDRHHQQKKRISKTGKVAITHYEVLKEFKGYSLLRVNLKTGRTHQIRVHLSSLGHPILGDELYGTKGKYPRMMLHSYEASFLHPVTHKQITITKELPYDMKQLVKEG